MTDEPKLAATTLLVRDSNAGLEVFMVARNYAVDSFSGALVFPGGKLEANDTSSQLRVLCRNQQHYDDQQLALRIASIREAFEESGALLARDINTGEYPNAARIADLGKYRSFLEKGELQLLELLEREKLELATDQLVHFSNWVTPPDWPAKRFDTHFYVAQIPADYPLLHDGSETVDSVWGTPKKFREQADEGRWNLVFPTRANLSRLELFDSTVTLLAASEAKVVEKIIPRYEQFDHEVKLSIPEDAGFPFRQLVIAQAKS